MKIVAPRWLAVTLLPALAAALYMVNTEITYAPVRFANARGFDTLSMIAVLLVFVIGPLLTTLVFAYPLARVHARHAAVAGLVIAFPTVAYAIHDRLFHPLENLSLVLLFALLTVFVPAAAAQAGRALAGSKLVVAQSRDGEMPMRAAEPRALQRMLLPLLAIAFFILREVIQPIVIDIALLPDTRAIELTCLLAAALFGPGLVALLLAYPVARLYGRHAWWVGAIVAFPTACRFAYTRFGTPHLPFVKIVHGVEFACLVVLLPLAAWIVQRRLTGSRLVIVPAAHEPSP
jgi:hypothetical protein